MNRFMWSEGGRTSSNMSTKLQLKPKTEATSYTNKVVTYTIQTLLTKWENKTIFVPT